MQTLRIKRTEDSIAAAFGGRRILICGASGNLGSHVARQLALLQTDLTLWGRDTRKLGDVALACEHHGSQAKVTSIDLNDIEAALCTLRQEDDAAPFDCAYFLSGAGDMREHGRAVDGPAQLIKLGLLNYVAPCALAAELGERMAKRGAGRIVLMGSAAATHPLPFAASYTSSKAGLSNFAEALRVALKGRGVTVTLISAGFFAPADKDTHGYSRPGEIPVELVARRTIVAAALGKSELVTPRRFLALRWLGRLLPRPLRDSLLLSIEP